MNLIDKIWPIRVAYAHCDVPCGIYTPEPAKTAADTIAKMVEKIQALPKDNLYPEHVEGPPTEATRNSFVRMVMTKEEHAEKCKRELLVLWTDYFKPEHLEMFPDLHETFWKAAKLCSKNKQSIDPEAAKELQDAVARIAEVFNKAEEGKNK